MSGTGVNPWWRYEEQNIPGGGHMMVNVGTGNFLLQADDMNVPHKGIALAFRRAYNSQSGHDVLGTDGAAPGMYGNGWTNTFDAHIVNRPSGGVSVYDIDGARYDYVLPAGWTYTPGRQVPSITPGQHATLAFDGACGVQWTKKNGTTYYFYFTNPNTACPSIATVGGYAGRLYQIVGRNQNTSITLSYSWDNGNAGAGGKISQIVATTESGLSTTLTFADFSAHRLLQTLTRPDGTTVSYAYSAQGGLASVTLPPNNAAGKPPVQKYGYTAVGSTGATILNYFLSPRWVDTNRTDGAAFQLGFTMPNGDNAHATLSQIDHYGFVDPTPADGTNTPIQTPPSNGSANTTVPYLSEYFGLGSPGSSATPTYRDTDGHYTNWVTDASGRPTQTQECTATQSQQCTGTLLLSGERWDADNNLVAEIEPRGFAPGANSESYETDYAYDANGNTIAVAQPPPLPGAFRPTFLYSYDSFNNLTAFCDANATHADRLDWTGVPAPSQTLCPANSLATRLIWSNPASGPVANPSPVYEPFGQLNSIVTPGTRAAPNGYARSIGYASAQQGGADFGLPTSVVGTSFSQNDPAVPSRSPTQSYTYDGNGNVVCYGGGVGTYALQYDTMSRRTVVADPDDGSGWCGNTVSATRTASYTAYFPDGSTMYAETPAQHAASGASPGSAGHAFTYDLDGNMLTEVFPSPSGGAATTFQSWYDGTDRLVEVQRGITTRYLYDLSQGGSVSVTSSGPFRAYGNLYAKLIRAGNTWPEQDATAFDALDRGVNTFRYAFQCLSCAALNVLTNVYDDPSAGLGLLAAVTSETGIKTSYAYDALGRQTGVSFSGDGGVTPARQFSYDANGNVLTRASSTSGVEQFIYDADGSVLQRSEGAGLTSPATYLYSYYPDGTKSAVSFQSPALSGSTSYAYRADGRRSALATAWNGLSANLSWAYTAAGREVAQNDSWGAKTMTYDPAGRLATLTMPAGSFTGLQYDNEGDIVGVSAYGLTTTRTYDATRQLLSDHDSPLACPASAAFKGNWSTYTYANGTQSSVTSISASCADNTLVSSSTTFQSDFRSGAVGNQYTPSVEPSPPPKFAGFCNGMPTPNKSTTYTYDASGRQLSSTTLNTTYQWTGACMWNKQTSTSASGSSYDGEGHELQYTVTPPGYPPSIVDAMQWGVNGHPAVATLGGQTLSLHWDGDDLLFATSASGALEQFNVEQSIVAQSGSSPIVTDRDMSGMRVSEHGPAGVDGLCRQNVYSYGAPVKCGQVAGNLGVVVYDRADGLDIGHGTVQGRRTYDAAMAQWTVPDAYEGEVNDPGSQRPYMWNRNSPYEYADPSGYDACVTHQGWDGENCITTYKIGSTDSRRSAGSQLMPNGETVAHAIARQNQTIHGIETAAAIVGLPVDAEGVLAAAGISRLTNVHHIVAQSAWRAAPARTQLAKYGLSVHDAENLVTLDKAFHAQLHTRSYYDAVNESLESAESVKEVRAALANFSRLLQQGWSPR